MKNILYIALLLMTTVSCGKYAEGLNTDPNNFTDAPGELIIGQANISWVLLSEGEAARLSGIFTDQFTGFSNQFINYDSYDVKSADFNGIWSNCYTSGIAQTRIVQDKALQSGNTRLLGVAQIVEAVMAAELAALYGDVPYSQSAQPVAFPSPNYDNQLEVFEAAQRLLDEGILNVGDSRVADFYGFPVFKNNGALWSQVGHSLKARYYLIAKQYDKALAEANLGIASVDNSLLANHADIQGQKNLFYQFGIEQRGGYMTASRSYLRKLINPSDVSVDRIIFTPGEEVRVTKYFQGTELNYNDDGYFGKEASYPIMGWFENQFIKAESLARLGREDEARVEINKVRARLTEDYGAPFPDVSAAGNTLLRIILEEKYITMIGSIQVFHDIRRTNNFLGIPVKSNVAPGIPQRFLYPDTEINANANFPGVVSLFAKTAINQ